jgi:hypothetical protein
MTLPPVGCPGTAPAVYSRGTWGTYPGTPRPSEPGVTAYLPIEKTGYGTPRGGLSKSPPSLCAYPLGTWGTCPGTPLGIAGVEQMIVLKAEAQRL